MSSKGNKKNVVIINDFDYIQGGASKVAIETANVLIENTEKYNVYFFSGDSNQKNSTLDKRIINISTKQGEALKDNNKLRGCINGIYNFKAKKELIKLLKKLDNQNTIIHIHGWTKCLSSSIFDAIFEMNFKEIVTMHDYFLACPNGGYYNYNKKEICNYNPLTLKCLKCNCDSRNYLFKIYRIIRMFVQNKIIKLNNKLENVISISDLSEEVLKKTLNTNVNIYRVYNPIDFEKENKKTDIKSNEYYLYVGRISAEKGVDLFCESISELNENGIVVGDGSQKQELEKKYSNIKFVGWKNNNEVKEYIKKARCLIFPSRWYEGAPLTPIEAMQFGVPCLISNKCAAREYINGKNGLTINLDKNDIIEKINQINENIENFSDAAYEFANKMKEKNYSKNIINLYNKILEEQ